MSETVREVHGTGSRSTLVRQSRTRRRAEFRVEVRSFRFHRPSRLARSPERHPEENEGSTLSLLEAAGNQARIRQAAPGEGTEVIVERMSHIMDRPRKRHPRRLLSGAIGIDGTRRCTLSGDDSPSQHGYLTVGLVACTETGRLNRNGSRKIRSRLAHIMGSKKVSPTGTSNLESRINGVDTFPEHGEI